MSKEGSSRIPGNYYARIAWESRARGMHSRIDRGDLPQEDKDLAKRLLISRRNRFSVAVPLNIPHRELTAREEAGVIFFVSLINSVDNHIDSSKKVPHSAYTRPFVERLADLPVNNTQITVGDLTKKVFDNVPAHKADPLGKYLEKMLILHEKQQDFPTGSYSYQDALDYRWQTTVPFVQTVADLLDIDPFRRSDIAHQAMAIQRIDDSMDISEDITDGNMNLFVGMATENGELDFIQAAMQDPAITPRQLFRMPPKSHQQYMKEFKNEIGTLDKRSRRGILRVLGKVLM